MAGKYGIRITHEAGPAGWAAGSDCSVLLFRTAKEAEKALNEMKSDPHYLWRCNAEVAEFSGFGKKKPEGEV